MKGDAADELEPTQITVHKENGTARYSWYEENGIWKMQTI